MNNIFIFLWVLVVLCFRPGLIGGEYGNIVVIPFFVLLSIYLTAKAKNGTIQQDIYRKKILLNTSLLCVYLSIQTIFLSNEIFIAFKSILTIFIVTYYLFKVLSVVDNVIVIRCYLTIHVALAVSILVSFILWVAAGFEYNSITLTSFPFFERNDIRILFPFSFAWSSTSYSTIIPSLDFLPHFVRFIGLYREPGAAQYFFLPALFYTFFIGRLRYKKIVQLILILAVLLLVSTQGYISLTIGLIIYYFIIYRDKKIKLSPLTFAIVLVLIVTVLYNLFEYGIANKLETGSGIARLYSFELGIDKFISNPLFGSGYYNDFAVGAENIEKFIGLGIFGFITQVGIIGLLLYARILLPVFSQKNWLEHILIVSPVLLASILSQPSYNETILWFILLLNYSNRQ